jgi:hypothetical protein
MRQRRRSDPWTGTRENNAAKANQDMSNLYGSECWTYLVSRRTGDASARPVSHARLPMGVAEASRLRLLDRMPNSTPFAIADLARQLATDPALDARLAEKRRCRDADEAAKPPTAYREEGQPGPDTISVASTRAITLPATISSKSWQSGAFPWRSGCVGGPWRNRPGHPILCEPPCHQLRRTTLHDAADRDRPPFLRAR